MLFYLLQWIEETYALPGFGVFQYITFRAALAMLFSLIVSLLVGKTVIELLKAKLIGEQIRALGPESHKSKRGTPTMGGTIIIAAIVLPILLWSDLANAYVWLLLLVTLLMGLIGFVDDYIKVFRKDKSGLKGKFKIFGQLAIGTIVGTLMVLHQDFQGPSPMLLNSGEIVEPNEYLKRIGFEEGDRLQDPKSLDQTSRKNTYPQKYRVQRRGQSEPVDIYIAAGDQRLVGRLLFEDSHNHFVTRTNIPFLKNHEFDYYALVSWMGASYYWGKLTYVLIAIFIVTAVSNAVNITDGLDGLAAGTTAIVGFALGGIAYVSGNLIFANYLNISFIPLSGEIFIFAAALTGACIGFLWYNAYPAQVFMGDTGSLALGGAVGVMALMVKKELLLPLLCGVFFVESLSVILQVTYFKYTKRKFGEGRRIFRMSPLHHHFELNGWHESKIVTRFWIVTILLAITALATFKLR